MQRRTICTMCCGCTTSKCAESTACGRPGLPGSLCLQEALGWVVLRQEDFPSHPAELGGWGGGGQMHRLLGTKWARHSCVSANIYTLCTRSVLGAWHTCEPDRLVSALRLLTVWWGRLSSSQIGSTECDCWNRTGGASWPQNQHQVSLIAHLRFDSFSIHL